MIGENKPASVLWQQVQAGNTAAFESVVHDHMNSVASVAYAGTGDLAGSEDVAQETFLVAWQSRDQLREPSRLAGWLCGIARNLARQWHRGRRVPVVAADEGREPADRAPSPVQRVISDEERQLVWSSLESIPDLYREALVLFYRNGQSVAEVAAALELSEDVVRQRLSRGRNLLRAEVARTVEQTLEHSRPGPQFVTSVMAGIAATGTLGAIANSAGGAAAGTLAAKTVGSAAGAMVAKAAGTGAAAGVAGGLIGAAGGIGGAWLGTWLPAQMAPTMAERRLLESSGRRVLGVSVAFTLAVLGFAALLAFRQGVLLASAGLAASAAAFVIWIIWTSVRLNREVMAIRAKVQPEDDPNPTWVKSRFGIPASGKARESRWIGRRGTSDLRLLGWPLWDFQCSDPALGSQDREPRQPLHARGWLAVGDRATGFVAIGGRAAGVFAFGGMAFGIVAFGGIALGLAALGGLAAGGLALGGLALGHSAIGGGAAGWQAAGGAAIGVHSAVGGLAIANDLADGGLALSRRQATGGQARAPEANTPAAQAATGAAFLADFMGTASARRDPVAFQRRVRTATWSVVIPCVGLALLLPLLMVRRRRPGEPQD